MGRLSKTGGKTVKKHWGDWNGGENDVEQNYGKAMDKMKKMWLRCETISDGKAMEKSRDYDEEVEKNNGKNIGKIAALMWDQNDAK